MIDDEVNARVLDDKQKTHAHTNTSCAELKYRNIVYLMNKQFNTSGSRN